MMLLNICLCGGFFSGGVEKGESPLEAVKREALEELNYNLVTENFRFKKVLKDKTVYVFVEKFDENQKLILNEGQGMGWYNLSDLEKLTMVDVDYKILKEDVFKYIK